MARKYNIFNIIIFIEYYIIGPTVWLIEYIILAIVYLVQIFIEILYNSRSSQFQKLTSFLVTKFLQLEFSGKLQPNLHTIRSDPFQPGIKDCVGSRRVSIAVDWTVFSRKLNKNGFLICGILCTFLKPLPSSLSQTIYHLFEQMLIRRVRFAWDDRWRHLTWSFLVTSIFPRLISKAHLNTN